MKLAGDLPSLPEIYIRVDELLETESATAIQIGDAVQNARIIDHEAFFTAGLLHDIGWLVIVKVTPSAYVTITGIAKTENRNVMQVEIEKLGVTHIDVGVALLEKWSIPGQIIQCIRMHHDADHIGPMAIETSIVALANQLSRHSLPGDEEEIAEILSTMPYWEKTKCTAEQIAIACRLADAQWLGVMESLGMLDLELSEVEEDSFLFKTTL